MIAVTKYIPGRVLRVISVTLLVVVVSAVIFWPRRLVMMILAGMVLGEERDRVKVEEVGLGER